VNQRNRSKPAKGSTTRQEYALPLDRFPHQPDSERVREAPPLVFEAAFDRFSMDREFNAKLTLEVPPQCSRVLSDHIQRLKDTTFLVQITGLPDFRQSSAGKPAGKRA